jgi:hypothetical protein
MGGLGSKFRKNSGRNSGSGPFSGIFGPGVAGIIFLGIALFWTFLIKETEMRHRCASRIINYLTLVAKHSKYIDFVDKYKINYEVNLQCCLLDVFGSPLDLSVGTSCK